MTQATSLGGVFFVAAELSMREYTALLTTRNTKAVDIIALNNNSLRSIGIQVKTNAPTSPHNGWLVSKKDKDMPAQASKNLVYVFVNLDREMKPSFYIAPGGVVQKLVRELKRSTGNIWYWVSRADLDDFKDNWDVVRSVTE